MTTQDKINKLSDAIHTMSKGMLYLDKDAKILSFYVDNTSSDNDINVVKLSSLEEAVLIIKGLTNDEPTFVSNYVSEKLTLFLWVELIFPS